MPGEASKTFSERCRTLFADILGHGRRWKTACATSLGIGRATLYRYLEDGATIPTDVLTRLASIERSIRPMDGPGTADMVRRYARALVDVQQVVDDMGSLKAGLPATARRIFDLAAALNFSSQTTCWPTDIAGLVQAARKPLFEWVSDLSWDPDGDFTVARFVEGGSVSPECVRLAAPGGDVDTEMAENAGYLKLRAICESLGSPAERDAAYVAWRRFVILRPVLSNWTADVYADSVLATLDSIDALVELFYQPVPEAFARSGKLRLCTVSGTILRLNGTGYETECREPTAVQAARRGEFTEMPFRPSMLQLRRSFRMFWCLPGRTELELEQRLVHAGWTCRMWPELDRVDLTATSPDGRRRIAVDVKDYLSPVRLAARFAGFKEYARDHQCFLVVPDYVLDASPLYSHRFEALRASKSQSPVSVRTLSGLIDELVGQ